MNNLEIITVDFSLDFNEFLDVLKSKVKRRGGGYIWVIDQKDRILPKTEQIISEQLNQFQPDCLHFSAQVIDPTTGIENEVLEQLIAPKQRELSGGNVNFVINYPHRNWPMIFDKVYRRNIFVDVLEAIDHSEIPTQNFESLFNFIAFDLIEAYRSVNQVLMIHYSSTSSLNYDIERSMQSFDSYIDRNRSVWPKGKIKLMEKIRTGIAFRLNPYDLDGQPKYNQLMTLERLPELIKLSPLRDLLLNYLDLEKISELDDIFTLTQSKSDSRHLSRNLSEPQRIVLVSYNLGIGGAEKVILSHAEAYRNLGFEVILMTNSTSKREYPLPKYISRVNLDDRGLNLVQRLTQFITVLIYLKPDFVMNHNTYDMDHWYYLVIARLLGIPWAQWAHHSALRLLDYNIYQRDDLFVKIYSLATYYVSVNRFDAFAQKATGISNSICIPNPIMMKSTQVKSREVIVDFSRLLYVGRLDERAKQISELPLILQEIVKTLPQVQLDIVGAEGAQTPDNFRSEFYARGLNSNVIFHGVKSVRELVHFYRNADLFIFTSTDESDSNVLLEASAYGLPIVMYEMPWLRVAQNNLGCIQVPQRDRKAFSKSVVKLLNDPAAYAVSSKAALQKVEELKRIDVSQMLLDLVHNRIRPPTFSVQEQAEYAEIMARFIGYNAIRNAQAKTKAKRELDVDLAWLLSREADAVKALIISKGDLELDKLRLERQFGILRKVRCGLGRIKRKIVSIAGN